MLGGFHNFVIRSRFYFFTSLPKTSYIRYILHISGLSTSNRIVPPEFISPFIVYIYDLDVFADSASVGFWLVGYIIF
jgi:hypothetical protein